MAWEKPAAKLVERFDANLPKQAQVERRQMFGCPCAFVNGNMFAGLHQQDIVLRLPEPRREALIASGAARQFEPMGRVMREYVALDEASSRGAALTGLMREAFTFASALPPKLPKKLRASKAKPAARVAKAPRAPRRGG